MLLLAEIHILMMPQVSANDPSRLLGKGVRGDPGRLLREEKTRKRIAKEKPKVSSLFVPFALLPTPNFDSA